MAKKRYTRAQLDAYEESFLWCRSFGHAWEFVGDKVGRKGSRITIEEEIECLHCAMTRYDWREGVTTWRKHLSNVGVTEWVAIAPDESVLDVEFDDGYGGSEGPALLVWTDTHVWFPVVYDGKEWLGSAPRNPQPEPQRHVGGE